MGAHVVYSGIAHLLMHPGVALHKNRTRKKNANLAAISLLRLNTAMYFLPFSEAEATDFQSVDLDSELRHMVTL